VSNQGWIKLHRKIVENEIWKERRVFSRAECWIDILLEVRHNEQPVNVVIKNCIVECQQGQSVRSIEQWAARWGMNKSKARRVLDLFKRCSMIDLECVKVSTRLTVLKFSEYNDQRHADETQMKHKRNTDETQMNPNKNVKNEKKERMEEDFISHCPPNDGHTDDFNHDLPVESPKTKKPRRDLKGQELLFERFWDVYPRKEGKKNALRAWLNLKPAPTNDDIDTLVEIVQTRAESDQWTKDGGQFIPLPATYINGKRWEDKGVIVKDPCVYNGDW
jgi:hypothetical protein